MRISDWSSDVCSSDLYYAVLIRVSPGYPPTEGRLHTRYAPVRHSRKPESFLPFDLHVLSLPLAFILSQDQTLRCSCSSFRSLRIQLDPTSGRSEEHTSELQSLMRISYAVFCLKK